MDINWSLAENQTVLRQSTAMFQPKVVTIQPGLTASQKEAARDSAAAQARSDWSNQATTAKSAVPSATDTEVGNCGAATIWFNDIAGTKTAKVDTRFTFDEYVGTYGYMTHVWNTSWRDFWSNTRAFLGILANTKKIQDSYTLNVNKSGSRYGAKIVDARFVVGTGTRTRVCFNVFGPAVDNVTVY